MDENSFHYGLRLKKLVENNFSTSKEFADILGFKRQTLNYWFEASFIQPKRLEPILKALKITYADFLNVPNKSITDEEIERLKAQLERCRSEKEDLMQQLLKSQQENIDTMRENKKYKVVGKFSDNK